MKSKVVYKTDAEEDGTGRGSEGRGQSNFELSINSDYVHEGQPTLVNIVGVDD